MNNVDVVLTRDRIMNEIWGYEYAGETRTVDVHIRSLRQKLGEQGAAIKTVRNVGYKLSQGNDVNYPPIKVSGLVTL